jgi:ABC-2 type transport system permease protein
VDAPRIRRGSALVALVAQREIVTQLRRQEFWGSLILMMVVVAASFGAQALFASGPSTYRVAVVDAPTAGLFAPALDAQPLPDGSDLIVTPSASDAEAETAVRASVFDAAVLADGSVVHLDGLAAPLAGALGATSSAVATRELLAAQGLNEATIAEVLVMKPLRERALDPDTRRDTERTVIALVGIVAVFFLMFSFGQAIAQGVLEEKSSRIVEVLLAKVRAGQLLTGKVLGLGVVVLVQILVLVTDGFVAAVAFDVITVPADALEVGLLVLVWFVPGYFLFATLWAVAGALVSRQEDVVNAAGPVSFLMTIGVLGALFPFTGVAPGVSTALSMVPGLSWSMMPIRMAREVVPWWQTVIAVVLIVAAIAALLRVAGRIYVGGLLENGGLLKATAAWRSAKESGLA